MTDAEATRIYKMLAADVAKEIVASDGFRLLVEAAAQKATSAVLDSRQLKTAVREVALQILAEMARRDAVGAVDLLLRRCDRLGVRVYLNPAGRLMTYPRKLLGLELQAAVQDRRDEIVAYLQAKAGGNGTAAQQKASTP